MPKLMPTDIKEEVKAVLKRTLNDPRYGRSYLTAHQILEKLPSQIRDQLIKERGTPGQGSGKYYAAASVVSDAAEMLPDIEIVFLDSSSLKVMLKDGTDLVAPGNPNVGLYRLK
ncbi:MAG TPA: hypothetical protein VMW89_19545 [Desulfatiglandales bacterium]|nr:hypothetical protein [Desulfatiglandales bacterium]